MKIAESWLREWVDTTLDSAALAEALTMAGHEVDSVDIQGNGLEGVIVAEVTSVSPHPDADRLSVCKVSTGSADPVEVVCGAPNVYESMKTALAVPGLTLPNGVKLRKAKIRGVTSSGMLCSPAELGLGIDSDGIMDLSADAPVGEALTDWLKLPDAVIDVDLTPNRGDCFSLLGIARDVAALSGSRLEPSAVASPAANCDVIQPVETPLPEACPSFAGRVVRNIDPHAKSPLWVVERLRRVGLRAIHPVVDITNYVMLEFGQPLHAYDIGKVSGTIRPRRSKAGERLVLLDEKEVELDDATLVITDDSGVIGLAGIMGGLSTAVTGDTVDVFFEAAYWPPEFMAGRARSYGMHTDASLRFERGVDPLGQARAVERATGLLLEIAGGDAGPLNHVLNEACLPDRQAVVLRGSRLRRVLGVDIESDEVAAILQRLGMEVAECDDGWSAKPPSYRFDLNLEVDLIEEVARIHGYESIPETNATADTVLPAVTETRIDTERAANLLVARDYQEAVTYSFIDRADNRRFTGSDEGIELENPISSGMSVMRGSMWPGLVAVAAANVARQQDRVRLFEIGRTFHGTLDAPIEVDRIAGLALGSNLPEQWAADDRELDFFDFKGDITALLALSAGRGEVAWVPGEHPALQPGQCARIKRSGREIGVAGRLHPRLASAHDLARGAFVFELDAQLALEADIPRAAAVSRFPAIRRDIAIVVDDAVASADIVAAIESVAPDVIREVRVFDIYRGPGIEAGLKSIAFGLILQETSRTLTDVDADSATTAAIRKLEQDFAAELRD